LSSYVGRFKHFVAYCVLTASASTINEKTGQIMGVCIFSELKNTMSSKKIFLHVKKNILVITKKRKT